MRYELRRDNTLPLSYWEFSLPAVWKVAKQSEGALIVVPIMSSQLSSRYQPFHKKSMLGGMVENQPWNYPSDFVSFIEGNGLLMSLHSLHKHQLQFFSVYQDDIDELRARGFRRIIFDKASWDRLGFHKQSAGMEKKDPMPFLIQEVI